VSKLKQRKLCILNSSKAQKTQTFVWEPMDGYNLDPKLLTWKRSLKKLKSKRKTKKIECFLKYCWYKFWFGTAPKFGSLKKLQQFILLKWHFPWNFVRKWTKFLSIISSISSQIKCSSSCNSVNWARWRINNGTLSRRFGLFFDTF
jgi:hypothetical protein